MRSSAPWAGSERASAPPRWRTSTDGSGDRTPGRRSPPTPPRPPRGGRRGGPRRRSRGGIAGVHVQARPRSGSGMAGAGGTRSSRPSDVTSSGSVSVQALQAVRISSARSIGQRKHPGVDLGDRMEGELQGGDDGEAPAAAARAIPPRRRACTRPRRRLPTRRPAPPGRGARRPRRPPPRARRLPPRPAAVHDGAVPGALGRHPVPLDTGDVDHPADVLGGLGDRRRRGLLVDGQVPTPAAPRPSRRPAAGPCGPRDRRPGRPDRAESRGSASSRPDAAGGSSTTLAGS